MSDRTQALQPALDPRILDHLGHKLRWELAAAPDEALPTKLARLLDRTVRAIRINEAPLDPGFVDELLSSLPELRAYALSLERDPVRADDLVQETMVRALANRDRFLMGTSLRAWLFTILKNHFLSMTRRRRREVEDVDGSFSERLSVDEDQNDKVSYGELMSALQCLRKDERDVLLMVGIDGLSYEEAASTMGCAIGTIKSRVNRARRRLALHMGLTEEDVIGGSRL